MSYGETTKPAPLTQDEKIAAAYAQGAKDGAERAVQWVANDSNMTKADEIEHWILNLLPASRDEMQARGVQFD